MTLISHRTKLYDEKKVYHRQSH